MKKTRSKKKIIISVLCVLLALAVLTPCMINAVVMLSASKYIISADEAAGRGADCVLVLGAKVNSNGTLSHMLEDRMSTGVDLYQSDAGKKILASGDHGRDSYDEAWVSTPTALRRTSASTASPYIILCARASPGARTSLCAFSSPSRLISARLSR